MNTHQLLIHRSHDGDVYYRVDEEGQLEAAMRRIYRRNAEQGCYDYLDRHHRVYAAAKAGDFKAIKAVLTMRQRAEYEGWSIVHTTDPGTVRRERT
jgi:hypothetical protein